MGIPGYCFTSTVRSSRLFGVECDFTKLDHFRVVFIGLAVKRKWNRLFVASRAPEHRETIDLWKVEEHNFHLVLIRGKKIKISRRTVSLGPHSVRKFLGPKKSKIFDLKIFHFHTISNENFRKF